MAQGAADAARIYGTPFVSGKDSLHNTFRSGGVSKSIPPVLLVSAISIVPGAPQTVGSDLKASDSVMVLVGPDAALPGSLCQPYLGGSGGAPAAFDGELGLKILNTIAAGMKERRFRAVHDLSEGGLAVAAAERDGLAQRRRPRQLGAGRGRGCLGRGLEVLLLCCRSPLSSAAPS